MIRARARNKMEGEKPTKFFCSLEKHCGVQKYIPKLKVEKAGTTLEIDDQDSVEREIFEFYRDLFAEKPTEITEVESFLENSSAISCPCLTDSQRKSMEGLITVAEMTSYLKKTRNNISPGSTGFTNEFFKFFWLDLREFIVNSVNYSYEKAYYL